MPQGHNQYEEQKLQVQLVQLLCHPYAIDLQQRNLQAKLKDATEAAGQTLQLQQTQGDPQALLKQH